MIEIHRRDQQRGNGNVGHGRKSGDGQTEGRRSPGRQGPPHRQMEQRQEADHVEKVRDRHQRHREEGGRAEESGQRRAGAEGRPGSCQTIASIKNVKGVQRPSG